MYVLTPEEFRFMFQYLLKDFEFMDVADKIRTKVIFDKVHPGPEGEEILSLFNIDSLEWDSIPT